VKKGVTPPQPKPEPPEIIVIKKPVIDEKGVVIEPAIIRKIVKPKQGEPAPKKPHYKEIVIGDTVELQKIEKKIQKQNNKPAPTIPQSKPQPKYIVIKEPVVNEKGVIVEPAVVKVLEGKEYKKKVIRDVKKIKHITKKI